MQKVTNLYNLYALGHTVGQVAKELDQGQVTFASIGIGLGLLVTHLSKMNADIPVPFESTKRTVTSFLATLELFRKTYNTPAAFYAPVSPIDRQKIIDAITQLEVQLMYELDALPIWFVTKRRAYSIDMLINNAEEVLESTDLPLLSKRTITDIREAGRAIAFSLPTAAGFHSVRATEGVARGYHEIVVGVRADASVPLGPLTNALRTSRDAQLSAGTIDKEDLLNMVIDMLTRVNNVYRKPLTHPDMILDSAPAMNVFDSAKCAIELMLEDGKKKRSGPIPPEFF